MTNYLYTTGNKEIKNLEYQFWEAYHRVMMHKKTKITHCNSLTGLIEMLENRRYYKSNNILIVFNRIPSEELNYITQRLIPKIGSKVNKLIYSKYYCTEEIILSYKNIEQYYDIETLKNHELYKYLELIRDCLINNIDYYNTKEIQELIKEKKIDTKERLDSMILGCLTGISNKRLHINKNNLGECWTNDCNIVKDRFGEYTCSNCKSKLNSVKHKLQDLEANSILSQGVLLSKLNIF